MIVSEALRLYPPVIAMIRRARVDVELGGYKIPRSTEILIPILALHHDQAIWGSDANEFNPARFSEGVARAAKHPFALIPFGLGVRNCIGQNLAILQDKLALAIILQRFRFRLAPTYQHAPTVLMLLYPQHGAPIIFSHLANPEAVAAQDQGSWWLMKMASYQSTPMEWPPTQGHDFQFKVVQRGKKSRHGTRAQFLIDSVVGFG